MKLVHAQQDSFARGVNDSAAVEELAPTEVRRLFDARLSLNGNGAQRRDGSKRTHASALNSGATVYGLGELVHLDGTQELVAFVGDTVYTSTDGGANWTQQATGLPTDYWSIVTTDACGTPTLYAANGGTSIYSWDGTTWGTVANAPSNVEFLSVFGGRLYVAGHDGETVQASDIKDFSEWTTGGGALSVKVSTHSGDTEINGLYQLGEAVLVFKRRSTSYIAGYGAETLVVEKGPEGGVSRSVGCLAPRSIHATSEDAVMWLSERGIEFYQLGGQIQLIGRPLQGLLDGLNHGHIASNPKVPVSTYWPRKNEYWVALPTGDATQNDRIVVWRPPGGSTTPAWWIFRPAFDVATFMAADRSSDGRMPYAGGYDGFLRAMEDGDRGDRASDESGGSTIQADLVTRPFTFGDQETYKRARVIRASIEAPYEASVEIGVVADGEEGETQTRDWSTGEGPTAHKVRVNDRGYALSGRIVWTDRDLKVQGVDMGAEPLRRAW